MAHRTPLAQFVIDALAERNESIPDFAERVKVNESGLYKFLRGEYAEPRQGTLDKIAGGFGMAPSELLRAVEAQSSDDFVEQAIRSRTAEMRDAVRGIDRVYWATIIKATFDRAIDGARDMAQLLTSPASPDAQLSIKADAELSKQEQRANSEDQGSQGPLALSKVRQLAALASY